VNDAIKALFCPADSMKDNNLKDSNSILLEYFNWSNLIYLFDIDVVKYAQYDLFWASIIYLYLRREVNHRSHFYRTFSNIFMLENCKKMLS
jgi:hypothetical protein